GSGRWGTAPDMTWRAASWPRVERCSASGRVNLPRHAEARHVEVRQGAYRDSVALMQASRTIAAAPGVSGAMIAMATELNLDLIQDLGFERPAGAGPNDMVVAVAAAAQGAPGAA